MVGNDINMLNFINNVFDVKRYKKKFHVNVASIFWYIVHTIQKCLLKTLYTC